MNDELERRLPPAWHKLVADPVNNIVFLAFGAFLGLTVAAFFTVVDIDRGTATSIAAIGGPVAAAIGAFLAAQYANERRDRKELQDYARSLAADLWFMENSVSTLRQVTLFETKWVNAFKLGWKMYFGDFSRDVEPFLWHATFDGRLPPRLRQRLRFLRRDTAEMSTLLGALVWQTGSSHDELVALQFTIRHPIERIHSNLSEIQRQLRFLSGLR